MKRKELIKLFEKNGLVHEPTSRQTEIDDLLAKKTIKRRGLK